MGTYIEIYDLLSYLNDSSLQGLYIYLLMTADKLNGLVLEIDLTKISDDTSISITKIKEYLKRLKSLKLIQLDKKRITFRN